MEPNIFRREHQLCFTVARPNQLDDGFYAENIGIVSSSNMEFLTWIFAHLFLAVYGNETIGIRCFVDAFY